MGDLNQRARVRTLYNLIGERGLYVSTNYDVFTKKPELIPLGMGAGYKVPLMEDSSAAYASPLLFASLTSLLNHGTMLITGAPGIGKTTSAEFAGHFFTDTPMDEILAAEIQGHPQLTEEKLVASYDIGKLITPPSKREVIPTKFLQCPVKILDEGNRVPPDTLSILMRLVDTGKAVYGGEVLTARAGPLYVTANYADEGTFEFTPPFLDRFDCAVMVISPQPWDLRKIRDRGDEKLNGNIHELLEVPEGLRLDFERIRNEINSLQEAEEHGVPEASSFADFFYGSIRFSEAASRYLARATKGIAWQKNQDNSPSGHFTDSPHTYTLNELSVRTVRAMQRYAKAYAWFNGKEKVEMDDLKTVMPYLLWHKLQPSSKALAEDPHYANDRIAFSEELIGKVENEYNDMLGSDEFYYYTFALGLIREGKWKGKKFTKEETRERVRDIITRIGNVDKPYAVTLANHIVSEYNNRFNGRYEQE